MNITTLPLGMLQTNCYIIENEGRCLIIDPGDEAEKLEAYLQERGLTPEAILLTHGHFDHVGAVKTLAADTDCRVFLCENDLALPKVMTRDLLHYTDAFTHGQELTLAGLTFTVHHTPGHTPGSVCLRFGDILFTGDTLFAGSIGRTDFPCGSNREMMDSLDYLKTLEDHLTVYPGHGPSTTMGREKQYNPYL